MKRYNVMRCTQCSTVLGTQDEIDENMCSSCLMERADLSLPRPEASRLAMNTRFDAFKLLPKARYDCWQGDEIALPAQHDLGDFRAALELQSDNPDIKRCGHFLDADDLLAVWESIAGEYHYVRPDVLAVAVAKRLYEVIDDWKYNAMAGDNYDEMINEATK